MHRSIHNLPTSSTRQHRVIARTNFSERVRRNVRENRKNSNLNKTKKKAVRKKTYRRKKVKRIRRRASRKMSKFTKTIKEEPEISTRTKFIKREKKNQILKKYLKTKKPKSRRRISKKKIKSRKIKAKKNILKKITEIDIKNNFGERNLTNIFKTRSINEEDLASIELTSQTSDYFLDDNTINKDKKIKYVNFFFLFFNTIFCF